MKYVPKFILSVTALLFVAFPLFAAPVPGLPAPDFTGIDTEGNQVTLSDFKGKTLVLEWTNHECPYVKKHYGSGNMQNLQRQFTEEGVIWISIISSAPGKQGHVSAAVANELTTTRGAYPSMVLLDEAGTIGKLYNARTSPEMFLINADGIVEYMGAIDDKPSSRAESLKGAHNYLLTAWQAVKAGTEPTTRVTQPYGCSVKYPG